MSEIQVFQTEHIQNLIYTVRGVQVMLDSDLAKLYSVETKQINRAVKRNKDRFPIEFIFQLSEAEREALRYQIGTLKKFRGAHRKYLPTFSLNKVNTDALRLVAILLKFQYQQFC